MNRVGPPTVTLGSGSASTAELLFVCRQTGFPRHFPSTRPSLPLPDLEGSRQKMLADQIWNRACCALRHFGVTQLPNLCRVSCELSTQGLCTISCDDIRQNDQYDQQRQACGHFTQEAAHLVESRIDIWGKCWRNAVFHPGTGYANSAISNASRCRSHSTGRSSIRSASCNVRGWRPSRMASTMSGASRVKR